MPATESSATIVTRRGDREIVLTREFDAPRELVFKAMTDPNHIPRWWGPRRYTTVVDKMDVRPGGKWRFINKGPDGEHAFRGEYREIVPPERIVTTEAFDESWYPGEAVGMIELSERPPGRTIPSDARRTQGSVGHVPVRAGAARDRTDSPPLQPPVPRDAHPEQHPAVIEAPDLGLPVGARAIADRDLEDPQVEPRGPEDEVEIPEGIHPGEFAPAESGATGSVVIRNSDRSFVSPRRAIAPIGAEDLNVNVP